MNLDHVGMENLNCVSWTHQILLPPDITLIERLKKFVSTANADICNDEKGTNVSVSI